MCDTFVDFARDEPDESTNPPRALTVTEASKSSPSENGTDSTYLLDKENEGRDHAWKRRTSPPTNTPYQNGKRSKHDSTAAATFYPIPLGPPMMRYTSSAAFSDISMPIHGLTSSRSFGPSGLFHGAVHPSVPLTLLRSTSTVGATGWMGLELDTKEEASLPTYPVGVRFSVDEINHHQSNYGDRRQRNSNHASLGDLSMAASALLDLTPTASMELQLQHSNRAQFEPHPPVTAYDRSGEHLPGVVGSYAHAKAFNTRLEERARRLLFNVPVTLMACKCKNTKCLKLYCTCFQTGAFCASYLCKCQGCNNTFEHSSPNGARTGAIYEILSRRLDAFDPRLRKKTGHGCSCKKSRCLQKYCDCFANGSACTPRCSCEDCSNDTSAAADGLPVANNKIVFVTKARAV